MKKTAIDQLGFLIHDVGRLLRRNFEKRGQEHGLSSAQWRLLVRVVREQNPTQARLAELMEIEPISVSRLVDRMEQGGWVKRCAHETDRRVNRVVPTDKSLAAYSTIKAVAADVFEEALTGVGEDQRQALMSALVVMVNNLSSDETATTSSNVEKQAAS
ncbi:MarR family winged helix-turn-helix transcriptional regulator [Hoeflea alexandrii]|mgnify:FL=1|uniref:MarR family transcriptional regulator n=1 Tax=Hoeflea alexandrii TaxID=288436 RepID=A0ABT1CTM0_9HYPH|nr:MarR family winged helix-turn-helix transcriptional regulator [Hoeflea alexandrii]MCO6409539.1 MarR family transcriptional regulator [Hoeflea alexandrii]MCY0152568.1 MarR family winged helix-turn-helix transcriptional regulator [Hoeflea alexandrii]